MDCVFYVDLIASKQRNTWNVLVLCPCPSEEDKLHNSPCEMESSLSIQQENCVRWLKEMFALLLTMFSLLKLYCISRIEICLRLRNH